MTFQNASCARRDFCVQKQELPFEGAAEDGHVVVVINRFAAAEDGEASGVFGQLHFINSIKLEALFRLQLAELFERLSHKGAFPALEATFDLRRKFHHSVVVSHLVSPPGFEAWKQSPTDGVDQCQRFDAVSP